MKFNIYVFISQIQSKYRLSRTLCVIIENEFHDISFQIETEYLFWDEIHLNRFNLSSFQQLNKHKEQF